MMILLFPSVVYSAGWVRYVNTGSTPGGNGTTNETTGDNRAYASLNEAEAALNGVLTDPCTIYCCGASTDTASVTIDGWTTGATYYLSIIGDNTTGKASQSHYRIKPQANARGIDIQEAYTKLKNIEVLGWSGYYEGIAALSVTNCVIENCIVHNPSGASYAGIALTGNDHKAINCIVYGVTNDNGFYASPTTAVKCELYNCVSYGNTNGFGGSNYPICFNCIAGNNTAYDYTVQYAGSEARNNISEDTTAPTGGTEITGVSFATDTNQNSGKPVIFTNLTAGSENFHLQFSVGTQPNVAIDAGYDASSFFATDIDGQTRTGTWDIGADEYVSAEPPAPAPSVPFLPQVMIWEN